MATELVNPQSNDWYERVIEEPVRDVVRLLRNNGWNTECSCGHQMYVQCEYVPDGDLMALQRLLTNFLHQKESPVTYDINIVIRVREGHSYPSLDIRFNPEP